jgi:hypothetical protein
MNDTGIFRGPMGIMNDRMLVSSLLEKWKCKPLGRIFIIR